MSDVKLCGTRMHENEKFLLKSSMYLAVTISMFSTSMKIYGWFVTSSAMVLASALDGAFDLLASFLNLVVVNMSLKPADDDHRFGHDKIEDLSSFAQSVFFFASAGFIIFAAIHNLFKDTHVFINNVTLVIMSISFVLTLILVTYQRYVLKKVNSSILKTDSLHYFVDLLSNATVIIGCLLANRFHYIDSIFAIGISIYLCFSSYKIFKDSVSNLIDQEFSPYKKKKVLSVLYDFLQAKKIMGAHDVKTRQTSHQNFIQVHVEFDENLMLRDAHDISDQISEALKLHFPNAEIIIHADIFGRNTDTIQYRDI